MEQGLDRRAEVSVDRSGREVQQVVEALGDRVAPVSMAGDRLLPVPDELAGLFPEGGLVRGRTMSCAGASATSLAMVLATPSIVAGGWLAVVDVPTIGLDAASEYGVPLERLVCIETRGEHRSESRSEPGSEPRRVAGDAERGRRWADVVAAAADGFDVLFVSVPDQVSSSTTRKLMSRVQRAGSVLIVLGEPGELPCDGVLRAEGRWEGIADGAGRLLHRRVVVSAGGRRIPGRRECRLSLPGTDPSGPLGGRRDDAPEPDEAPGRHPGRAVEAVA